MVVSSAWHARYSDILSFILESSVVYKPISYIIELLILCSLHLLHSYSFTKTLSITKYGSTLYTRNKTFFELKSRGYRKIGMGYESLHTMELLSVQCLQVDDVIPILSPAVYCGFGRCGSQRFA